MVRDVDGLSAEKTHQVRYLPPLYLRPWFIPALALLVGIPIAVSQGTRMRRRNRLRKRRFNPYVAGAPVLDERLFVGREVLLSRILQGIHNNSILLFGERRIGKTTLQHHLRRRLLALQDPEYEFYPVYIDLQGTPEDRFFRTMAEDVLAEFGPLVNQDGVTPHLSEADGYDDIGSESEADDLSDDWSVPNDGIDMFLVANISDDFVGISPVPGDCDKGDKSDGLLGGEDRKSVV